MARPKLTAIEKEFSKEKRRIQQIIRRAQKRGFIFPITKIQTPKNITKEDVLKLQQITPDTLYSQSRYKDPKTGEIFSGTEGRRIERYRANKKANENRKGIRTKQENIYIPHPRSTPLSKEYTKERQRIKNFITRAKKRGYIFPDDILEQRPKTITKQDVKRLKSIKPEDIYEKGYYLINPETGEVVSGLKGREHERRKTAEKAKQTRQEKIRLQQEKTQAQQEKNPKSRPEPQLVDVVLKHMEDEIDRWDGNTGWSVYTKGKKERDRGKARSLLNMAIQQHGRDGLAIIAEQNADELLYYLEIILYDSDGKNGAVSEAFNQFIDILFGGSLSMEESSEIEERALNMYYYSDEELEDINQNMWGG